MPRPVRGNRNTATNRTAEVPASTTTTTTTPNRASADAGDGVDSPITSSDVRPEFRISVRGVRGQPTPKPALAADWYDASLAGEAKHRAALDCAPIYEKEVKAAERKEGRELTDDEKEKIEDKVVDKHFKGFYATHYGDIIKDDGTKDTALTEALTREGARLTARARDPFTPVAQGDPAARAKEVVLWEDKDSMVLIDLFCRSPKALVVPKDQAMFPGDLDPVKLDKLAAISAKVSDAFTAVTGSQAAAIWINPPQRLTLKQLHVHVQPKLPNWERQRRPRDTPMDPALVAEQQKFYAELTQEIAKQLTPSGG